MLASSRELKNRLSWLNNLARGHQHLDNSADGDTLQLLDNIRFSGIFVKENNFTLAKKRSCLDLHL